MNYLQKERWIKKDMQTIITKNSKETQELGAELAKKMRGGEVICLSGELGAGKTTFTQGFLKELGAKGPYTSPTFLIMKQYKLGTRNAKRVTQNAEHKMRSTIHVVRYAYHVDAYRVDEKDVLNLGWEEIIADKKNVVIVEWAERIEKIIPKKAIQIKFEWVNEDERRITLSA